MPKANSKDAKEAPASFEAALAELESIVQTMEQGSAPLEASLAAYERGTTLLRYCQEALAGAEQKIRILEGQTLRELDAPQEVPLGGAPQEVPLGDATPAGDE